MTNESDLLGYSLAKTLGLGEADTASTSEHVGYSFVNKTGLSENNEANIWSPSGADMANISDHAVNDATHKSDTVGNGAPNRPGLARNGMVCRLPNGISSDSEYHYDDDLESTSSSLAHQTGGDSKIAVDVDGVPLSSEAC